MLTMFENDNGLPIVWLTYENNQVLIKSNNILLKEQSLHNDLNIITYVLTWSRQGIDCLIDSLNTKGITLGD